MIEETLRQAIIVDSNKINKDVVHVGSTVKVLDLEFNEEMVYKIVGTIESDPDRGYISNESPIGKALMGKKKGETVEIKTPGGSFKVKITSVD